MKSSSNQLVPSYSVADIQLDVGDHEFKKGVKILEGGGVKNVRNDKHSFYADVVGSKAGQWYSVSVSAKEFDRGDCTCYLGCNDQLCKHMVALAIHVVREFSPQGAEEIVQPLDQAVCSGEVRNIKPDEIDKIKVNITKALKYVKPYSGPSRTWFQYQDSLSRGCRLLLLTLSDLPVCEKSVDIIVDVLKRLERKLMNGVDDSDGTVGGCIEEVVELLNLFSDINPSLISYINKKIPQGEMFDWHTVYQHYL